MPRFAAVVLALLLALALAGPASRPSPAAAAVMLDDSTLVDRWTLPNGLRVVTRTIGGSGVAAITVGYRFGREDDPANRHGLAQLLGELAFMGPAGDVPARTIGDLDSQRPVGWGYPVMRHATLLTEGATLAQFPGVLAEVARRMRGVDVNAATLKAAVAQVKLDLREQLEGSAEVSAGFVVREVAAGRTDAEIRALVAGRDLDAVTPAEALQWMRKVHVPANAVLSLTGDLGNVDVRRMVESLFGSIPAGAPLPGAPETKLQPAARALARTQGPVAAVGLIAPALDDTTHPAFYLATAAMGLMGEQVTRRAGDTKQRFQFGLFDEPELARLFPELPPGGAPPAQLSEAVAVLAEPLQQLPMLPRWLGMSRDRMRHLLGGPMHATIARQLTKNPRLLVGFSRAQASCELIRGPAFWDVYRERLERVDASAAVPMLQRMTDPRYQVLVVLQPGAGPKAAAKKP